MQACLRSSTTFRSSLGGGFEVTGIQTISVCFLVSACIKDVLSNAPNQNVFPNFPDDVRDDEIDNWAAKKIQTSFKKYQHQKSLSQDRPETPENRAARVARANATSGASAAASAAP